MSFDLNLYRNNSKHSFKQIELKPILDKKFPDSFIDLVDGQVQKFTINRNSQHQISFEFQPEYGCFRTFLKFGSSQPVIDHFINTVRRVALALDMKIQDPQADNKLIEPADFL